MMKHPFLFFLLFLFLVSPTNAQTIYTRSQLLEDFKVIKDIIIHTNPVLTKPKRDSLGKIFDKEINNFHLEKGSALDFVNYFTQFINENATLDYDSHATFTVPFDAFSMDSVYFPLPLYLLDDHLLVNVENAEIPFGSMIRTINGMGVDSLLKQLRGNEQDKPFLNYRLNSTFGFYYYNQFGGNQTFNITYTSNNTDTMLRSATCMGINLEEMQKISNLAVFPIKTGPSPELIFTQYNPQTQTFYFKLNSFSWAQKDSVNSSEHSRQLMDSVFKEIKSKAPKTLIIDIQNNTGGEILNPGILFSFLTDSILIERFVMQLMPLKQIPYNNIKSFSVDTVRSRQDLEQKLEPFYDHFTEKDHMMVQHQYSKNAPQPNRFTGRVVLLVNEGTFSAAHYFTALMKVSNRSSIIGSPPGGIIKNVTAGVSLGYQLPNTKLGVDLPLICINYDERIYQALKGADRITLPPNSSTPFPSKYSYFLKKQNWDLEEVYATIREEAP